jgi:thiosulfate reductase cytochrome b subunit
MTRWTPRVVRFSLGKTAIAEADVHNAEAAETEVATTEAEKAEVAETDVEKAEDAKTVAKTEVAAEISPGEAASLKSPADDENTGADTTTDNDAPVPVSPAVALQPQAIAIYEHPLVIRITHWVNAISLTVMILSGIQIFAAFPSFSAKVPQHNLITYPPHFTPTSIGGWFRGLALGGWLAGGWNWHFLFVWPFVISGVLYVVYQIFTGRFRALLFVPRDIPGVWPMVKHYFLFAKKPPLTQQYNPLQKLAYSSTIFFGIISVLSGLVVFNPVQFSWLGALMGGFHYARLWHFLAMCGFLAFIPGHLIMVAIHGWNNFIAMLTGWKRDPEYSKPTTNISGD